MALSGTILVSTEALENQASEVEAQLNSMSSLFDDIKNLVDGMNSYWTGEASEAHRNIYSNKLDSIDEMLRRYKEHVNDLRTMAGIYQQAETTATNLADELPASTLD